MGYRIVRMSREMFEQMFVEGYTLPTQENQRIRVTKGLPEGSKLDAVSMDVFFDSYGIALRFSHPDWPEQPGVRVPEAPVEFAMETTTEFRPWLLDHLSIAEKFELKEQLEREIAATPTEEMLSEASTQAALWPFRAQLTPELLADCVLPGGDASYAAESCRREFVPGSPLNPGNPDADAPHVVE